nr:hypothetical protein [Endozoicomonas sp.]
MDVTGVFVCHDSSISGVRQEATEKNTPSVWGRIVRVIAPIMAIGGAVAACLVSGGLFIGLSAAVAVVGGVASIYLLYKSISDRHVSTEPKSYPQANAGSAATTTTRTGPVLSTAADSALSVASKPFVMQAQRAPDPGSVSFSFPGVPSITTPVPDNPRAISSPLVMPWFLPAQDYVGIPYSGSARDTPFV